MLCKKVDEVALMGYSIISPAYTLRSTFKPLSLVFVFLRNPLYIRYDHVQEQK